MDAPGCGQHPAARLLSFPLKRKSRRELIAGGLNNALRARILGNGRTSGSDGRTRVSLAMLKETNVKVHAYPADHMWRDLNFSMHYEGETRCIIRAPVVAGLCNDQGAVQVGFIATLFDLVGGELAARTAYPDWIATADMVMYSKQRARAGELMAVGSVLRAGRGSVVIEADIIAKPRQSEISNINRVCHCSLHQTAQQRRHGADIQG